MTTLNDINGFYIFLNALAGLILFLFGISSMSSGLKSMNSDRMKKILSKSATNIFSGILTGLVATAIIDSSSAIIIIVIAMVNAELLTARQSYGIILGSYIGTALGSQIIALNIGEYSVIPLLIGFLMMIMSKTDKTKHLAKSILGLGLIFFGLYQIGISVEPLKDTQEFSSAMLQIENPWKGGLAGLIVTTIIQSSSATVGIVISLANQNLISLSAGIAVMLGAEIGTCSDTLVASLGRSREALKAGIFHLMFSALSSITGLLLISPFLTLLQYISNDLSVARQIANAHVLFNVLAVLVFVGFVPLMARLLDRVVPDKLVSQ